MDPVKVYEVDQTGVVVDSSPVSAPPAAFTKAQNAIADPIGEKGSIRKRPGLKRLNTTAGAGSVTGGASAPVTLGSAGPNFVNPFTDSNVTLVPLRTFSYKVRPGPTFNDDSGTFDFDWHFDYEDLLDSIDPEFEAAEELDILDITDVALTPDDDSTPLPSQPTIVPYNWQGTFAAMSYLTCDADGTQHVTFPTTNATLGFGPLIQPAFGFRDYVTTNSFAYSSLGAAVNITLHNRVAAALNNIIYYGVDFTSQPAIRAYGGTYDRHIRTFRASNGTVAKTILNVITANSKVYIAVWLSGVTTANTGVGAVFEYDPTTNATRQLGANFPVDQVPYSLLWAYGRIWAGTASNAASCRLYWMRPDQDSDFTLDNTFAAGESVVGDLAVFQGLIYAGVLNRTAAAGTLRCYVRSTVGVYTTSDSGTLDTNAAHGNTRGYYSLLVWPREDSGVSSPASALYAVRYGATEDNVVGSAAIRKFNGSAWSATSIVSAAAGSTLYGQFGLSSNQIKPFMAFGEGAAYTVTLNGTAFTDAAANLTIVSRGMFPTFFYSVPGTNGVMLNLPSGL